MEVTISSIIVRSDDSLNVKIKNMNKILNKFAKQNHLDMAFQLEYIERTPYASGLHLHVQGTKTLASNFISHLKKN